MNGNQGRRAGNSGSIRLLNIFVSCLLFTFLFCISSQAWAQDVIRFGASLSLTGKMSTEGRRVRDGYDYYVKHINEKGGMPIKGKNYKVEIVYYDDESDPNTATRLTEKLIVEDKVDFLLGPYSSTCTMPASTVAEKYKMPMVAAHAASTPIFERGYKYLFVTLSSLDQYFGNILKMAAELTPRPETVALINENALAPQVSVDAAEAEANDWVSKSCTNRNTPRGPRTFLDAG